MIDKQRQCAVCAAVNHGPLSMELKLGTNGAVAPPSHGDFVHLVNVSVTAPMEKKVSFHGRRYEDVLDTRCTALGCSALRPSAHTCEQPRF